MSKKKFIKKVACLGFSANPPHVGHLDAAKQILRHADTDEVWLIPCNQHNFKRGLWSKKHRWAMTKLMEGQRIKACDIELQRKGISYTIDTVREIKKKYPNYFFTWIIGSDIIADKNYLRWHKWRELSRLITFWVIQRPGFLIKKKRLSRCFNILNIKAPDVSSTMIRDRLNKGLSIKQLVTPKVERYIKRNRPSILRGSTS